MRLSNRENQPYDQHSGEWEERGGEINCCFVLILGSAVKSPQQNLHLLFFLFFFAHKSTEQKRENANVHRMQMVMMRMLDWNTICYIIYLNRTLGIETESIELWDGGRRIK